MYSSKKSRLRAGYRFTAYLLASFALIVVLCHILYLREANQVSQRLKDSELVRVGAISEYLRIELLPVATDLRSLADGDGLHAYFATHAQVNLDRAIHRATFYSLEQPNYDQIRALDSHGREILRVNQGGVVVPQDQLQDKSDRPYFRRSRLLVPDQIYLSAFDLNQENGQLETPWKPTLRFSTPIYDADGERDGVYVINYSGTELLTRLTKASTFAQRLRILNSDGYWIRADAPAREWGFMLPERAGQTLARTAPDFWRRIVGSRTGQEAFEGGFFTWERVDTAELFAKNRVAARTDEPFIIIGSQVTAAEIAERIQGFQATFVWIAIGLILLATTTLTFIAARQVAISDLRRNEEDLAVTLQSIGDAVIATDTEGRVARLNGVAQELTGWSQADARGRPIADVFRIIHETTREPAEVPVKHVLATGLMHGLAHHTLLIARDGTEHAIADSAAPIKGRNGAVYGVVLVFRDVSAERKAEQRLSAARAELDRFFSLSLDFLCISSGDGYFRRMSPAVTDILGWSVEEMLTKPYLDFVHPDDIPATKREVERQISRGEPVFHFENRYRHKDGSWRVLSWRSVPQPDGLMYATARDVTETKAIDEEVRQLNADLLAHAGQLEAANQELEAFSYSVSHDLRAPLRHVQGYVEILSEETGQELSEKARRYLGIIASASGEMSQLIDDLLSFSRMGRSAMADQVVDLDLLLKDVLKGMEETFGDRQILCRVAALPKVRGDTAMLKLVMVNLLSNAVKYTRLKPVAEIDVGWTPVENHQAQVFVRDNGAGFDMEYADKLFGVFQRLHRADEFEGTGIGLANVRRIVTRHGGKVWAEAKPNLGATFYFTLNLAASSAVQREASA